MLTDFNYFQIFLLIPLGAAFGTLTNGIGAYLKARVRHKGKIVPCYTLFLWVAFLYLTMVQYFLALYESFSNSHMVTGIEMAIHLATVTVFAVMAKILVPDFNAPDVWDKINQEEGRFWLQEFYRRHRKSLATCGIILLVTVISNYGAVHGGFSGYWTSRLPYHIIYAGILIVMGFTKPRDKENKDPWFSNMQRVAASAAVTMILLIIFVTG